jgi:hypothetical protein
MIEKKNSLFLKSSESSSQINYTFLISLNILNFNEGGKDS